MSSVIRLWVSVLDSVPWAVITRSFAFLDFSYTQYRHDLLVSIEGPIPWETDSEVTQQEVYSVVLSRAHKQVQRERGRQDRLSRGRRQAVVQFQK